MPRGEAGYIRVSDQERVDGGGVRLLRLHAVRMRVTRASHRQPAYLSKFTGVYTAVYTAVCAYQQTY